MNSIEFRKSPETGWHVIVRGGTYHRASANHQNFNWDACTHVHPLAHNHLNLALSLISNERGQNVNWLVLESALLAWCRADILMHHTGKNYPMGSTEKTTRLNRCGQYINYCRQSLGTSCSVICRVMMSEHEITS